MNDQAKQELYLELLTLGYTDDTIVDLIDGCSDRNMLFSQIKLLEIKPNVVSDSISIANPRKKIDQEISAKVQMKTQEAALAKNKLFQQTERKLSNTMMDLNEPIFSGKSMVNLSNLHKYEAKPNEQVVAKGFSWNKIPKVNPELSAEKFKQIRTISRRQEKLESISSTFELTTLSNKKVPKVLADKIPELSLKFNPSLSLIPNKVGFFLTLINTHLSSSPKSQNISDSACITASLKYLTS